MIYIFDNDATGLKSFCDTSHDVATVICQK